MHSIGLGGVIIFLIAAAIIAALFSTRRPAPGLLAALVILGAVFVLATFNFRHGL
jgi:hypothetical protein